MSVDNGARAGSRASDADRDRVLDLLGTHYAHGRLTLDELSERLDEAYWARTDQDLEHTLRELPAGSPEGSGSRRGWRRVRVPGWFLGVNGICTSVWAATCLGSGLYYFWPMWVILGTGIPVVIEAAQGGRSEPAPALAGEHRPEPPNDVSAVTGRVVRTVLFVDVVGSTERAAFMGDVGWNRLLAEHEKHVRAAVIGCGGHIVFSKGDEVVAAFAVPAAAVECAGKVRAAARSLSLEVRGGVHAGEIEQQGPDIRGLAMHIGQRICAAAQPGQLLVSSTVRDLLIGSRLQFTDDGDHELKGLQGAWRLYSVADQS